MYLGRLMDDVQSLFESISSRTKESSLSYTLDVLDRLLKFRATLEREYDAFEQMDSGLAEHFRSRDAQTIFVQHRVRVVPATPHVGPATDARTHHMARVASSRHCRPF
jgi:hypothetical protein